MVGLSPSLDIKKSDFVQFGEALELTVACSFICFAKCIFIASYKFAYFWRGVLKAGRVRLFYFLNN